DGEQLRDTDVQWLLRRAARNRAALDALATAYAGAATRERLTAAVQTLAALRLTLPRDRAATAESVDLALRHADALASLGAAGGRKESASSARALIAAWWGAEEGPAQAGALPPGARGRPAALRRRIKDAEDRR